MSWEERNGTRYYTRSRRQNGKIVREYFGRGRVAELHAKLDELKREEREEAQAVERLRRQQANDLDQQLADLRDATNAAVDQKGDIVAL